MDALAKDQPAGCNTSKIISSLPQKMKMKMKIKAKIFLSKTRNA